MLENFAARYAMRGAFIRQMAGHHVLLWPACGVTAFRHRERVWPAGDGQIGLFEAMLPLYPANLLGLPALVIPFDMTADGVPVGIQLVGRPYDEELLLEVAVRLEEARGPFPAPPL